MAVTVYRWDDASAPVLSAANGALIGVLDACLVDGYGAKAAAGWSKAFSGTNKAAYLQGTGGNGHYLRVDNSTSNQYPRWRGYEAMSDVDTGTGPFPTDAQVSGGLFMITSSTTDSTARPWVLIADAKRFYLYVGRAQTTAEGLASTAYAPIVFFGSIISLKSGDAYHTAIIASSTAAATTNSLASMPSTSVAIAGHYLARDNNQTGTSLACSKCSDQRGESHTIMGTSDAVYPDPITGGMLLAQVFVQEPSGYLSRGIMPGLWNPLHNLPANPGDTFSGTTTGGLNGKSFILLDASAGSTRGRVALETSDTWE